MNELICLYVFRWPRTTGNLNKTALRLRNLRAWIAIILAAPTGAFLVYLGASMLFSLSSK